MAYGDDISQMADEVQIAIMKGASFHDAFKYVAHGRGIFWSSEKDRYNYFFSQVRKRLSGRKNGLLRNSLRGSRPWQHGKIIRTRLPRGISPHRLKPGIEVEVDEDPYLPRSTQLSLPLEPAIE